ncbi:uncharacterized protein EI90DRAFT_2911527, partial [Cantharellus anzutake]|uniref:uncharacterized protein n=1 Tax=Cantharellus anzutake TaxID=1750568 RepID=UPI001902F189
QSDPVRRVMVLWCRSCGAEQPSQNICVYRDDLLTITKEKAGVTQDLYTDPTLPHCNIECPACQHHDAVFYQDQSKRTETRMILFYVCTHCGTNFVDPAVSTPQILLPLCTIPNWGQFAYSSLSSLS